MPLLCRLLAQEILGMISGPGGEVGKFCYEI